MKWHRIPGRFAVDQNGNFAIVTAVLLPMMMLATGFGLNIAQVTLTRSNLLNALDSAVTSTARDLTLGVIEEKDARKSIEAFLLVNSNTGFASADRVVLDAVSIDRNGGTVDASASVDVDLLFPLFSMGDSQRVSTASAAAYSNKKIEVAMMLDITGSMQGQKIKDLKNAASMAVDTFLGMNRDKNDPRVRVAIVPYAEAVNTGPLAHVVYVERSHRSSSEPPKLEDPIPAAGGTAPDKCATEREGDYQFYDDGPYTAMVNRDYRLDDKVCPSSPLVPLSADANALKTVISGFRANGYTAGQIGIQWSWYLLSPQWRSVLAKDQKPAEFDAKKVAKFAILMTDGEFNTAYAGVADDPKSDREQNNQAGNSRGNAEKLCDAMKKDGIEIFTVGFKLTERNAKKIMAYCASEDKKGVVHYYEASTGADLVDAYQKIANDVERLALTK